MELHVGTSGYSYKEWKGTFYPEALPAKDMLRFYGERFGTVEINNTHYRMPKTAVLESWAAAVPADFQFVLKAHRRITHMQRLKDSGESVSFLCRERPGSPFRGDRGLGLSALAASRLRRCGAEGVAGPGAETRLAGRVRVLQARR
jgi:hypothetical protein